MTEHRVGRNFTALIATTLFFVVLGGVVLASTFYDLLVIPIGIAFFLLLSLGSFLRPVPAFLTVVFCSLLIPLDLSVEIVPLPRIGPTRIIMGAFFLGLFLRILVHGRILTGYRAIYPLFGGACLYILSASVSTYVSVAPVVSIYAVVGREILEQLFLFYLFLYFLQVPGIWGKLRNTLYAVTAIICLLAFVEAWMGDNPMIPLIPNAWPDFRAGILRCRATFFHPIAFACYLNLIFPFVMVDFFATRRTEVRVAMVFLGGLILVAALLTVSRAPWIILALEIMAVIAWECRNDLRRMVLIITLVFIGISFAFLAYQLNETVQNLFAPFINPSSVEEGSSEYYRVVVFEAVWERVQSPRIFFGYGPNAFNYADIEVTYDNSTRIIQEPDLHYARILFEFGLVGSGLILLLIGRGLWHSVRRLSQVSPARQRWVIAGVVGVVGFLFVNFTVSMFSMFPLGMIFWMCLAVALTESRPVSPPHEEVTAQALLPIR